MLNIEHNIQRQGQGPGQKGEIKMADNKMFSTPHWFRTPISKDGKFYFRRIIGMDEQGKVIYAKDAPWTEEGKDGTPVTDTAILEKLEKYFGNCAPAMETVTIPKFPTVPQEMEDDRTGFDFPADPGWQTDTGMGDLGSDPE